MSDPGTTGDRLLVRRAEVLVTMDAGLDLEALVHRQNRVSKAMLGQAGLV
jgi:hypothetical protein